MSYSQNRVGDALAEPPMLYTTGNTADDPQESAQYNEQGPMELTDPSTSNAGLNYSSAMPLPGNMLFWTTDDPRETVIWGHETILDPNGVGTRRPIEFTINTPAGYSVQTKSFIYPHHGGPGAEFWWATLMQLGLCTYNDAQIPMAHFLRPGTTSDCSLFYVEGDGRCFEWCRDPNQPLVFTLYDIPTGCIHAQYVGGPFEKPNLYPYMQYHWSQDDALLMFAILSISIRRWTDIYDLC